VGGDDASVGQELAGVLKDHDTVAEEAPSLLRVVGHETGRLAI
jgi:hypothetical protein